MVPDALSSRDRVGEGHTAYRITDEELEKEICDRISAASEIEWRVFTTDGGSGHYKAVRKVFPQAGHSGAYGNVSRLTNPKSEGRLESDRLAMTCHKKTNNEGYTGAACLERLIRNICQDNK